MCENIADGGATQVVDLRSDFVARPTPAMVEAMLRAARQPCGFGLREDTIVADLENRAAEVIGKDDALFVPTCTMANQIALHIHCRPGELFATEAEAHVVTSESAATAALSGAMPKMIPAQAAALEREGVLVLPFGDDVRLVTHHEITENAVEITLKAFHSVLSGASHGP